MVLTPLSKLRSNGHHTTYALVVDALDECDDNRNIGIILRLFADTQSLKLAQLRVFLTSRPEIPIRYGFSRMSDSEHKDVILHNISRSIIDHDISVFLRDSLRVVTHERFLDTEWPGEEAIRCMVQIACGLFIWAATATKFIREGGQFAARRLHLILKHSKDVIAAPEKHLDEIYTTVLKHSIPLELSDEEKEELYSLMRLILGSIAALLSPLFQLSLSRLLSITKEDVNLTLGGVHSIVDVPKEQTSPLRLHHPSFREFLFDKNRCRDSNFLVDEKQAHRILLQGCIQVMSTSLKEDSCGVNIRVCLWRSWRVVK
jgi:hypothetical protein